MFRENAAGEIENIYNLKLINKTQQTQRYRLELADTEGFRLQGEHEVNLGAGEILSLPVSVARTDDSGPAGSRPLRFVVRSLDQPGTEASASSTFVSPSR
ncbi:Ubp3 associated protein Bre5 [compost metagenome]